MLYRLTDQTGSLKIAVLVRKTCYEYKTDLKRFSMQICDFFVEFNYNFRLHCID